MGNLLKDVAYVGALIGLIIGILVFTAGIVSILIN